MVVGVHQDDRDSLCGLLNLIDHLPPVRRPMLEASKGVALILDSRMALYAVDDDCSHWPNFDTYSALTFKDPKLFGLYLE